MLGETWLARKKQKLGPLRRRREGRPGEKICKLREKNFVTGNSSVIMGKEKNSQNQELAQTAAEHSRQRP